MIRFTFYMTLSLAVVIAAVVWFSDRPGAVSIEWQGWLVELSVSRLVLAAAVALVVLVTTAVAVVLGRWLADVTDHTKLTVPEQAPFAGGHTPEVHAWHRFHVRYYTMAILFLAFDMEMVFMYPWAVVFVEEGLKALAEMGMFLAILSLGILYGWREGIFRWQ